jgi:alanyl-tRNA synthetase
MITAKELKKKYLEFFKSKNHAIINSASLIPENDPTVLFTTAGMHPLVPFLMGQEHPLGTRLTDVQKCLRTQDIDEVGDKTHTTFFEMLGNWSLGEYFKKEAISYSFEFLTKTLNLDLSRLAVTCFEGDDNAPRDEEAAEIWLNLGVSKERIAFLPKEDNWWGPAGETGPCGPDTEMFYWTPNNIPAPQNFDPSDKRWVEIWNDVFMQYNKNKDGSFTPLKQKNVDTGLGVERVTMILQGKENVFETELFLPIFKKISEVTNTKPNDKNIISYRVLADHIRASTFILGDERGVTPSNVDQGYILRRYIRRCIRHLMLLNPETKDKLEELSSVVIELYKDEYPILAQKADFIKEEFKKEEDKFQKVIDNGLNKIYKKMKSLALCLSDGPDKKDFEAIKLLDPMVAMKCKEIELDAKWVFDMLQSFGMPYEMTLEEIETTFGAKIKNKKELIVEVQKMYEEHQELSRKGAEQKFKGGLSESSDKTKKLHTATHILNEVLREVLSSDIKQKGSNITSERLRFDFNFDRKLTNEEKQNVENRVNEIIDAKMPITKEKMKLDDALKSGAQSEFGTRYPDEVWVYSIGDFSKEICMGPHVENTSELGKFKIKKEESSAAGIRRIKAVLIKN